MFNKKEKSVILAGCRHKTVNFCRTGNVYGKSQQQQVWRALSHRRETPCVFDPALISDRRSFAENPPAIVVCLPLGGKMNNGKRISLAQ